MLDRKVANVFFFKYDSNVLILGTYFVGATGIIADGFVRFKSPTSDATRLLMFSFSLLRLVSFYAIE
jgi:hypothetical protein